MRAELRWLTRSLLLVTGAVVVAVALVAGTGPHAGDPRPASLLPLNPRAATQLHADLVWALASLALAITVAVRMTTAPAAVLRSIRALLALVVAQAVLGYLQLVAGLPAVLVGLHMLGAVLLFTASAWAHLSTTGPTAMVASPGRQLAAP